MFDLISIGDAMQDMFVELKQASILSSKNKMTLNLCVTYADKIPASRIEHQVAGNSANVAVGASRFGLKTAFSSIVGDDPAGQAIRETMEKEGVDTRYIVTDQGKKNNYSIVLNFKRERTIIVYHEPREYRMPSLDATHWIYFSSLGQGKTALQKRSFYKFHDDVISYVREKAVKLAFNPGTYQLRMQRSMLLKVLRVTEALFVNVQEAELLVGTHEKTNTKELGIISLLLGLHKFGPKNVVITDGPKGAFFSDGGSFLKIGIFPARVVERTGAGDSFAAGFVSALLHKKTTGEALVWGSINAASVVSFIGPQPGLLTKKVLVERMKHTPQFRPRSF